MWLITSNVLKMRIKMPVDNFEKAMPFPQLIIGLVMKMFFVLKIVKTDEYKPTWSKP